MSTNKNRRPQTQKSTRNPEMAQAFREFRRSNAAMPHKNKSKYNRNDFDMERDY